MRIDGLLLRRLAKFGAQHMPAWFVRAAPGFFAWVFTVLLRGKRKQVAETWRWLGRKGTLSEVFSTVSEYAHCITESLAEGRFPQDVTAEGDEQIETALRAGRGLVIVTAHTGAWDVGAAELAKKLKVPITMVMAPEHSVAARRLHDEVRRRTGLRVQHVGERATDALPLLAELEKGHAVALQLDRPPASGRLVSSELFSRPFPVPEGIFRLAQLTGAPIIPVFCRRLGSFSHHVRVFPPICLPRDAGQAEVARTAKRLLENLEQFIQLDPRQWFYFSDPPEPYGNSRRPN